MEYKILKYELLKNTVESCFTFIKYKSLDNNDNHDYITFDLKVPSNPLVDIDILNLNNLSHYEITKKIDKIIKNKQYSYKTNKSFQIFLNWLNNIQQNNIEEEC